jgi:hypothetical protein
MKVNQAQKTLSRPKAWDSSKVYKCQDVPSGEEPDYVPPSSLWVINKTDATIVQLQVDDGLLLEPGEPFDEGAPIGRTCALNTIEECLDESKFEYLTDIGADRPHTIWLSLRLPTGEYITKVAKDISVNAESDDTFLVIE